MGSVKKEKNGTYTVRYSYKGKDGKRHQPKERGFIKKRDAEDRLTAIENELMTGEFVEPNMITVPQLAKSLIDEYEQKYKSGKVEWQTWQYYKGMISGRFNEWWAGYAVQDTSSYDVECFLDFLRDLKNKQGEPKLNPNTIHKHYKVIRTLFNYAIRKKIRRDNPIEDVDPPETIPPKHDFWDPEIIPEVIELFRGTEIEYHVRLGLLTALREGEVCGIHEDFIDFNNGEFEVREQAQNITGEGIVFKKPKAAASMAALPMTKEIENLFRDRILWIKKNRLRLGEKYCMEYDGRLSVREDGTFISPKQIYEIYKRKLLSQNKIPYIKFHDLRHTCAVWHLENETDMKTLQALLRHGSYKVTYDTYADITKKTKKTAMSKLSLPK